MRGSYRRIEHVRRTIRYEVEAPLDLSGLQTVLSEEKPMDEHIALVFVVETEREVPDGQ